MDYQAFSSKTKTIKSFIENKKRSKYKFVTNPRNTIVRVHACIAGVRKSTQSSRIAICTHRTGTILIVKWIDFIRNKTFANEIQSIVTSFATKQSLATLSQFEIGSPDGHALGRMHSGLPHCTIVVIDDGFQKFNKKKNSYLPLRFELATVRALQCIVWCNYYSHRNDPSNLKNIINEWTNQFSQKTNEWIQWLYLWRIVGKFCRSNRQSLYRNSNRDKAMTPHLPNKPLNKTKSSTYLKRNQKRKHEKHTSAFVSLPLTGEPSWQAIGSAQNAVGLNRWTIN